MNSTPFSTNWSSNLTFLSNHQWITICTLHEQRRTVVQNVYQTEQSRIQQRNDSTGCVTVHLFETVGGMRSEVAVVQFEGDIGGKGCGVDYV